MFCRLFPLSPYCARICTSFLVCLLKCPALSLSNNLYTSWRCKVWCMNTLRPILVSCRYTCGPVMSLHCVSICTLCCVMGINSMYYRNNKPSLSLCPLSLSHSAPPPQLYLSFSPLLQVLVVSSLPVDWAVTKSPVSLIMTLRSLLSPMPAALAVAASLSAPLKMTPSPPLPPWLTVTIL